MARTLHLFVLSLLLAAVVALAWALPAALADPLPETPDETVAIDTVVSEPAPIVRELLEERTAESQVFLLEDGSRLLRIYDGPVFYQDKASDAWLAIDTDLVALAPDLFAPASTPFDLVFRSSTREQLPVLLGYEGYVVAFDLQGYAEGAPALAGESVVYDVPEAQARLVYETTTSGVKETIELASAKAPATYTFFCSHEGLELREDESGQWGFYASEAKAPVFLMGELEVFDSCAGELGAAYCTKARLTVEPTKGGSLISYSLPQEWLTDPARVFPVKIDPTVTIKGTSNTWDTFLNYSYPNTSYGSSEQLKVGYIPAEGDHLALIRFDLDDLTAANRYVTAASLNMRCYDRPATARNFLIYCAKHSWGEAATWNSYVETYGSGDIVSFQVGQALASASSWMSLSCRGMTQAWVSGNEPAYGFLLDDSSESGSEYYSGRFRSSEYTNPTYVPYYEIAYADNPVSATASCDRTSYRLGDTVTVTVNLSGTKLSDLREVRLGVNRVDGPYRGVLCWYHKSPPDENWISRPYEVKNGGSAGEGGYFAYYRGPNDVYQSRRITPLLGQCEMNAAHTQVKFRFEIGDNWGDVQANDLDLNLVLSPDPDSVYWDEGEPRWASGWETKAAAAFDVVPVLSEAPAATVTSPSPEDNSDWLVHTDVNADGVEENTQSNDNSKGRGSVTLTWPEVTCADGYRVYLWDGHTYEPVGATAGSEATEWTSSGLDLYPADSEIASPTWPGGATGNPFYRVATPGDSSRIGLLEPSGYSGSAGLLAGDGTYLYARARSGQTGSAYWQRIDPATQAVTQFGPSLAAKPALSAFFSNGRVYSGYVTKSAEETSISGVLTADPWTSGGAIKFSSPPLERDTGAQIIASTSDVLFATDGTYIYNVAYTDSVAGDGSPNYDGFRIKRYTMDGTWVSGETTEIPMPSFKLSHVLADDDYLYLCEWTGAAGARVLKVDKEGRATVVNLWTEDQSATKACAGFYDSTNDDFWLGHLTTNSFHLYAGVTGGVELRDDPNALYAQTDSTSDSYASNTWTHYSFRVVPFNCESGEAAIGESVGVAVTLDKRTRHAYEAPVRTTYAIDELPDHAVEAVLDVAAPVPLSDDALHLGLSVTDLALSSWGPPALLERYYSSASAATGYYAPGWRFGFERALDLTQRASGFIDYVDAYGEHFTFRGSDTAWSAPEGLHARLVRAGAAYTLTFKDRAYLRFDATSGALLAEGDARGNEVTYAIGASEVTITAANGRKIIATISSGTITSAVTQTQSGANEQSVTYTVGSAVATATTPLSKDSGGTIERQRKVTYTYLSPSDLLLARIDVVGVDANGQLVTTEPTKREEFSYAASGSRRLEGADLPDYFATPSVAGARVFFAYSPSTSEIRIDRSGESGGGLVTVSRYLRYNPTGTLRATSTGWTADETPEPAFTSYAYAPDNQPAGSVSPSGVTSTSVIDVRGNEIARATMRGAGTVNALSYDANPDGIDDVVTTSYGPLGATTHITYTSIPERLVGEVQTEGAGYTPHVPDPALPTAVHEAAHAPDVGSASEANLARTRYTYADATLTGADGLQKTYEMRLTREEVAVAGAPSSPVWSVTDYQSPDLSGAAGTTVTYDVGYAPPNDPTMEAPASGDEDYAGVNVDLLSVATYDGFGRVLTQASRGPNSGYGDSPTLVETENNTYDLAGRLITTLGPNAAGVGRVARSASYDILNRETESYTWNDLARDQSQNLIKADWQRTYYETTSAGARLRTQALNGDPALGTVGAVLGEAVTDHDPMGRLWWSSDTSVGGLHAEEHHDLAGNVTEAWPEDCQQANGTNLTSHTSGDGWSTQKTYDTDNRVLTAHEPSTDPDKLTTMSYARDGALAEQTNPDGRFARYTYDSAGNVATVSGPDDDYDAEDAAYETVTSAYRYDSQGQVVLETDAGLGETYYSYDCAGRVTLELRPSSEPLSVAWAQDTRTYTTTNAVGWRMREHSGDVEDDGVADDVDTEWVYKPDGSVARETVGRMSSGSEMVTSFTYDDAGRVTAKEVDRGNGETARTTYAYDHFGRLASETRQKVVSGTATTQRETTYAYDTLGRELSREVKVRDEQSATLPTAISDAITYTTNDAALGNASVTKVTSYPVAALTVSPFTQPDPITETVKSDGHGRAVSYAVSVPNVGTTPTYGLSRQVTERDAADRVRALQVAKTTGESQGGTSTATWSYNSLGQLAAQGGLGFGSGGATYAYNSATGLRKTMTADLKLGPDIDERDEYYGEGRVKRAGPAADPDWGLYTYNRHGDLKTATLNSTRTFGYGAQHRLRWTEDGGGTRTYYAWDEANARRIAEGPGVLSGDTWSAPSTYPVTYDYDEAGALVHWEDNAVSSDKDKADYTYDAEGQRTRTTLTEDYADMAANQTRTTTDYLYDGLALVSETITKQVGTESPKVWQLFYFYDTEGRPWAAVDRKLSTSAGSTHSFYFVTDDRGDVLELLEADHIAFGSYRYDVYGRPTETTARTTSTTAMHYSWMAPITADRSLLRYAGYVYDAHSELYYLQRRYYDAILRQFLSRDPWRSDGPESPYQYCGGNPVSAIDPWGLYITASGERNDPRRRLPGRGTVNTGNSGWQPSGIWRYPTGTGHRGADGSSGTKPLAHWGGRVRGGQTPGWVSSAARAAGRLGERMQSAAASSLETLGEGQVLWGEANMTSGDMVLDWAQDYRDSIVDAKVDQGVQHVEAEAELWGNTAGSIHDLERRVHNYFVSKGWVVEPEDYPDSYNTRDFRNASPKCLQSKYNWYMNVKFAPVDVRKTLGQ